MIKCDTSKLLEQLQKFHKESIKKMEGMVQIFAYKITWQAIENTPIGSITPDNEWMYNLPSRLRVLPAEVGSAKGGWTVTLNGPSRIIFPERAEDENAANIKTNAEMALESYKLGADVYIMNSVRYVASDGWTLPKFGSLEGGYSSQAPNGIMGPTMESITGIYQLQLNEFYRAS